jgi:hypothetical protein
MLRMPSHLARLFILILLSPVASGPGGCGPGFPSSAAAMTEASACLLLFATLILPAFRVDFLWHQISSICLQQRKATQIVPAC